ncbi:DNA alkylation repair protein, partial [Streptococcus agalactiae]|nr:DNA alkylation repair protein [Streptococcus agalactiae]
MDLFLSLERKFKAASDKEVSKQQEAYLRHHFKCYGIKSPERRMLYKELIKAAKRQAKIDWQLLDKCWQSDYREYHHFVLDYLLAMSQFLTYNDCSRLEFYARHQQWWDSIDVLTKIFGNLSLKDDKVMNLLSEWSLDQDFWMRRLAIEHQLGFKEKTNTDILS